MRITDRQQRIIPKKSRGELFIKSPKNKRFKNQRGAAVLGVSPINVKIPEFLVLLGVRKKGKKKKEKRLRSDFHEISFLVPDLFYF